MSREPKRKVALFVLVFSLIACVVSAAMYFSTTSAVPKSSYLEIPESAYDQPAQEEAILQFVSGTEYIPGQTGQVIVEARYRNGSSALISEGETLLIDSTQQYTYDNVSQDNTGSIQQVDTYTANFQADEDPNTTANVSASAIKIPIKEYGFESYWDFEGDFNDSIGSLNAIPQNNDYKFISGDGVDGGTAVYLNGSTGIDMRYQPANHHYQFLPSNGELTFAFRFKGNASSTKSLATSKTSLTNDDNGIRMRYNTGDDLTIWVMGSGGIVTPVDRDNWSTWVWTFDPTNSTLLGYANGQLIINQTRQIMYHGSNWHLGTQFEESADDTLKWVGWFDDSAYSTTAISPQQAQYLSNTSDYSGFKLVENNTYESTAQTLSQDVEIIDFDITATGNYSVQFTCNADDQSPDWTGYGDGNDVPCVTNGDSLKYRMRLETENTEITDIQAQAFITTDDLWEGKATYMDGGPFAGAAVTFGKFPESYGAGVGCEWEFNAGDPRYVCGPSGHKAMQRDLQGFPGIAMGVQATLSLSQPKSGGGDAGATYAHMVIADKDANRWRYTRQRFNTAGTETYRGPEGGSANGLTFDLLRFNLFEIIDGESTLLVNANGSEDFCNFVDVFDNGVLRCNGAINSETAKKDFKMYVQNGRAYVEYEGQVIIDTPTEYELSENTTYGFVSHRLNNNYMMELNVYDVQEVTNATQPQLAEETNCVAAVQYPDKTDYFSNKQMILNNNGNAYTTFEVPSPEGVYEYQTICNILGNSQTASKSFHVTDPGIGAMVVK